MSVVAIIGVLVAVAYPSYLSQVKRANRSAAQQFMADVATREQQILMDLRSYVTVAATADFSNAPTASPTGLQLTVPSKALSFYDFSVSASNPATAAPSFTITAVPKGNQASDGNLTLDSAGTKLPANKW